ncbi:MAG: NUDIX hydrolase [Gammaproteobacteria bacterium]|jgi:8-oxo-dGTP pyrophosphatase MutT (NUDIX family)|nr:NUDIX hydrolase [Gammaproteobacteria bacterium]
MKTIAAAIPNMGSSMPPAWAVRSSQEIYNNGFFRLRRDCCALTQIPAATTDLYVLEMPDCVSVVPITPDGEIILIDQYRHGVAQWVLECPGGSIKSDHDDPASAAARELREETGYAAGELEYLGTHHLNPSGQTSQVHTFLAHDCRVDSGAALEPFEDLSICVVTRAELRALLQNSARFQTSTLASLMLVLVSSQWKMT